MIKITTETINEDEFECTAELHGSAQELIRDFYSLHDTLQKNTSASLLYGIAIKKWESEHEDK